MKRKSIFGGVLVSFAFVLFVVSLGTPRPPESALTPMEALGKSLFFDKISQPPWMSCAVCHGPDVGWTGPVAGINQHGGVYRGAVPQRFGNRKPPSSAYATFSPIFHYDAETGLFVGGNFWDGRATGERLGNPAADQALGPFLNVVEQNMPSKQAVCAHVAKSKYSKLFEEVWGPGALDCSEAGVEATYDKIGLSIAAYEASSEVNPFSSKFDVYWTACLEAGNSPEACGLAEGDKSTLDPKNVLTVVEWDGLIEYGEYCAPCHISHQPGPGGVPPLFTDFTYDNIGVPRNPENPFYDMDKVFLDDGSPINPLGDAFVDFGLGDFLRTRPEWADKADENDGKFKVPTLRNVDKRTGKGFPKAYMHNGVFKTLKEVVHFYNTRDVPGENWPPPEVDRNVNREIFEGVPLGNLELSEAAEDAIVAFLKTLSDGYAPVAAPAAVSPVLTTHPTVTIINAQNHRLPVKTALHQSFPNPFNPETWIPYQLAEAAVVTVEIYDSSGRLIRTLPLGRKPAGFYVSQARAAYWDGHNDAGERVSSGIYFYRLQAGHFSEMRKLTILK